MKDRDNVFGTTTPMEPAWNENNEPFAAALVLPAISAPPQAYKKLISALNAANMATAVMHYGRALPDSVLGEPTPGTFAYLADVAIPRALHAMHQQFGPTPVWIIAHSLGAQIAVLAAKASGIDAEGLIFVAGGTPFYRRFPGAKSKAMVVAATTAVRIVASGVGFWPGRFLRVGADESAPLVRDWNTLALTGDFSRLREVGPLSHGNPAADGCQRVVAGFFTDDSLAPESAVRALVDQCPGTRKQVVNLGPAGGHMRWLRRPDPVVQHVLDVIGEE